MTENSSLGELEQVILLAVLRLGDQAYAVPVHDEIRRCTGRDMSRGSIYITLDRLETKGYLRSRLADPTPERGGRAKRYYTLRPRAVGVDHDPGRVEDLLHVHVHRAGHAAQLRGDLLGDLEIRVRFR